MKIRRFKNSDVDQIARLYHETIRTVNSADYTRRQLEAWAPDDLYFRDWAKECGSKYTVVAETDGQVIGFAELEDNGHIDCFFCHKDYQRMGVGQALYRALEKYAERRGLESLSADVSLTARPFFSRMGFELEKEQTVTTRGVKFINYLMTKML
ncbi:MAG: GNAT family N-acetyltransferase [Balneolaceae bacterium]|nr:GNAT family N-acetyltransferase [Balneolaceae bacterium]